MFNDRPEKTKNGPSTTIYNHSMNVDQLVFENGAWSGFDQLKRHASDYQLLLVFAEKSLLQHPEVVPALQVVFPSAKIASVSTAGEVYNKQSHDNTAVCIALYFEHTQLEIANDNISSFNHDSGALGKSLASRLPVENLSHVLVLSDGHIVNGSDLIGGIIQVLGTDIPVSGGMAGDGNQFSQTLSGLNNEIAPGNVILIGFYGSRFRVGISVQRGFSFFGPERTVTKSEKNVLYEIDGENALELYKRYLGPFADELPSSALLFPIAILNESETEPLVRTILSIDETKGSMTFAGNLPEGSRIRLMRSNLNQLIEKAKTGGQEAAGRFSRPPALALVMNCVGRKTILQSRKNEEIEELANVFDSHTLVAGFYTYGEFSSWENPALVCDLHNQTVVVTVMDEI